MIVVVVGAAWGFACLLVCIFIWACRALDPDVNDRVATLEDELDELAAHQGQCAITVTLSPTQAIDAELVRLVATRGLVRNRSRWS